MGSCLSKKNTSPSPCPLPDPLVQIKPNNEAEKKKAQEETVRKEIFVIKHRKSHEIDRRSEEEKNGVEKKVTEKAEVSNNVTNGGLGNGSGMVTAASVRTSSCTKEEVDAILIQCGRLSRSSSTDKAALSGSNGSCDNNSNFKRGKKYSGSKRSYDFDNEIGDKDRENDKKKGNGGEENNYDDNVVDGDEGVVERIHRHRQRQRQSRAASSSPRGRRASSREREQQQQQRSGVRESVGSGGGRRVSRSPGRRSESPITTSNGATPTTAGAVSGRPGKMISVPATVSSLAMDKSNNGGVEPPSAAAVKRIQVKRNVGEAAVGVGSRSAASPRSRSPARTNVRAFNENQNGHSNQPQQQPLSLSRSNSRKAEQSPYRRNPLSEIDNNTIGFEQLALSSNKATNNNNLHQAPAQKPNAENLSNGKVVLQVDNKSSSNKGTLDNNAVNLNCRAKEQQMVGEAKGLQSMISNVAVTMIPSGAESLQPQPLTRSRSSRRSRDLDINPETLLNPTPSYTALLLEDIQNFHQKTTPAFSLPPCVTKACSILEAVADLNSSTSSNLSCAFSEDRNKNPKTDQFNKIDDNSSSGANPAGKKRIDTKDPIVESEVIVSDDLMEPSFHKYVTVRRGIVGGGDMEEQESSGSNSFVGGQQHWLSSSSWEPNSADSTDCWTSSRSTTREVDTSTLGFQKPAFSESDMDEARRKLSEKKRESDHQRTGIGRGRVGSSRGFYAMPTAAAAST